MSEQSKDVSDVEVAYLDLSNRREPGPMQAHLLEACPVHRVDQHDPPFFVVSRDADVRSVLRDTPTFLSEQGPGVEYTPGGVLGSTDRPDHTRQRRVLAQAFTPAAMAALEPRIATIAAEIFDAFVGAGEGDFVAGYAGPFPATAIAELLGVPVADRDRFREWSDSIVAGLGGEDLEQQLVTRREMHAYLGALVDERLAALDRGAALPDDVIARMCRAAHDEGLLSRNEMISLAVQMLVAGHETTTSLLGLIVYRLIERPELQARVRADRSLVVPLIEEALRFDGPVQGLFRTTASDVELHGTTIPAGAKVQVLFAGANRDPRRWDEPDELRPDRWVGVTTPTHVAFGHGIHFCIGAPLARMEARLSLDLVLDGMDDLALAGEPELVRPFILRGFRSLPLRWTPIG